MIRIGREMPLSEFKFIYYMEYSHRMLGRVLGVFFGVPLLFFASRGYLTPTLKRSLAGLFVLGGFQVRHFSKSIVVISFGGEETWCWSTVGYLNMWLDKLMN